MRRAIAGEESLIPETQGESHIQRTVGRVRVAVGEMRYGQVIIHVRDGVITQIERSERTRVFPSSEQ